MNLALTLTLLLFLVGGAVLFGIALGVWHDGKEEKETKT